MSYPLKYLYDTLDRIEEILYNNGSGYVTTYSILCGTAAGALMAACPVAAVPISSFFATTESVLQNIVDNQPISIIVIEGVVAATLGAATGTWGSDFANNSIYDDFIDAIPKIVKGNHPSIKRLQKKHYEKLENMRLNRRCHLNLKVFPQSVLRRGPILWLRDISDYGHKKNTSEKCVPVPVLD